jgi:hypothetical protein
MAKPEIIHLQTRHSGGDYISSDMKVKVPDHDFDVEFIMPDGRWVLFQYRIEGQSLDICLEQNCRTIVWKGQDLQSAKPKPGLKNTFPEVGQVYFDLSNPNRKDRTDERK